jgi:nucleoid-associated protein YgaU
MGLFDFVKDAGVALFGGGEKTQKRDLDEVLADKRKAEALTALVRDMGMKVDELSIKFREGCATIGGRCDSQADREKVVLLVGNTQGVARVDDRMGVAAGPDAVAAPAAKTTALYTVKSGDSLSRIAKAHYGDAMKYKLIFEANRPMLKDPDKIYPGQVLRIPPLES